jgi:enamine deaminase RidA (YjgF/YER057c/UK114 family)
MDDICQATVFLKHREDLDRLTPILSARGLDGLPMVCTIDDVCRDDLLVEIDATATMPHRFGDDD